MITTKNLVRLVIILSVVTLTLGIYYKSVIVIGVSIAVVIITIIYGALKERYPSKNSKDESISEDNDLVEEDLDFINEPIEMPSETAKATYDFIRKNSSKYTTDVLTDLSSNGGSLLKKGETLPLVLTEIILTLNNEVIRLRTNQNALIKNWGKHFGEDLKKYQNLKVIDFR